MRDSGIASLVEVRRPSAQARQDAYTRRPPRDLRGLRTEIVRRSCSTIVHVPLNISIKNGLKISHVCTGRDNLLPAAEISRKDCQAGPPFLILVVARMGSSGHQTMGAITAVAESLKLACMFDKAEY